MAETVAIQYRAFLSYSHTNTDWAKWLHARLEGFAVDRDLVGRETPWGPVPKTLRPIFRDRDDFGGGKSLTDATVAALDSSAALIVLCSPAAASRPAVNEEVRLFRSRHPERPVIPVVIDGTCPENFPPALRFELDADGVISDRPITILGPDLREAADGKNLGIAKTVAGLTGLGPDDVYRRAERVRRRRLRSWIAVLCVLVATFAGLAVWAEINRREAVLQRREADLQRQHAEQTLAAATRTANSLVSDLARRFRNVVGMPTDLIKDILDRARALTEELNKSGQVTPRLKRAEAEALMEIETSLRAIGDTSGARAAADQSRKIFEELLATNPESTDFQRELSVSLNRLGDAQVAQSDLAGALKFYRDALAIGERLAKSDAGNAVWQGDLANSYINIAGVLNLRSDPAGALKSYGDALAIRERLAAANPRNANLQNSLAESYGTVGRMQVHQGHLSGALKSYRDELAACRT